jgi:hypothetical protein
MKNGKINIKIYDNEVTTKTIGIPDLPEFLLAAFTSIQSMALRTIRSTPVIHDPDYSEINPQEAIRKEIYDMLNIGMSNVLHNIAPDLELRPDLTTEAILRAENQIIEEQYEQLRMFKEEAED